MITAGTRVQVTTGSAKRKNLRKVTGTVVDFTSRTLSETSAALLAVVKADNGEIVTEALSRVTEIAEEPKPSKIRFESVTCRRCDGERRSAAWGSVGGGWCFQCDGAGFQLTQAGKDARLAYDALIAKARPFPGARLKADIKRQIMREIVAQYPGASLVF